jgi:hypothetical protein
LPALAWGHASMQTVDKILDYIQDHPKP